MRDTSKSMRDGPKKGKKQEEKMRDRSFKVYLSFNTPLYFNVLSQKNETMRVIFFFLLVERGD